MSWPKHCRACEHLIYPLSWQYAVSWSHAARGLCVPCYNQARYADTLVDVERPSRSRDELMAEWEILRGEGYSKRQAAERLGVTFSTFDRAFHRARRSGDPRAVVTGPKARTA